MNETNFLEKVNGIYYYITDNCIVATDNDKIFKLTPEGISKLEEMALLLAESGYLNQEIKEKIDEKINSKYSQYEFENNEGKSLKKNIPLKECWPELNNYYQKLIDENLKDFYYYAFEFIFCGGPNYALTHEVIQSEDKLRKHLNVQANSFLNTFIINKFNKVIDEAIKKGIDNIQPQIQFLAEQLKNINFTAKDEKNIWDNGLFLLEIKRRFIYNKFHLMIVNILKKYFDNIETLDKKIISKLKYSIICIFNVINSQDKKINQLQKGLLEANLPADNNDTLIKLSNELDFEYSKILSKFSNFLIRTKYVIDKDKLNEMQDIIYNKFVNNVLNKAKENKNFTVNLEYLQKAFKMTINNFITENDINKIMDIYYDSVEYFEEGNSEEDSDSYSKPLSISDENVKDTDINFNLFAETKDIVKQIKLKYNNPKHIEEIARIFKAFKWELVNTNLGDDYVSIFKGKDNNNEIKNRINYSQLGLITNISDFKAQKYWNNISPILNEYFNNDQQIKLLDILSQIIDSLENY